MTFVGVVENVGQGINASGVTVIVIGGLAAAVAAALRITQHQPQVYQRLRQQLGRTILLGLELLVAADIIRTVAITPTLQSVVVLAGIVLIRTFLSFSLELKITRRRPWSPTPAAPTTSATPPSGGTQHS